MYSASSLARGAFFAGPDLTSSTSIQYTTNYILELLSWSQFGPHKLLKPFNYRFKEKSANSGCYLYHICTYVNHAISQKNCTFWLNAQYSFLNLHLHRNYCVYKFNKKYFQNKTDVDWNLWHIEMRNIK